MLHLFARTDITTMRRMHALRMATTALIGSQAAYSSAQDPGSMDTDAAGIGAAAATTVVAATMGAAATVMAIEPDMAADTAEETCVVVTTAPSMVTLAAVSAVTPVDSTVILVADSMAALAADSMQVEAGPTLVVEAMAAVTGN